MPTADDFDLRASKRQRLDHGATTPVPPQSSRLFAPHRTIGLVSPTAVPFTSLPLGKTSFQISTSVGRSLQTYDLLKGLNLVFLSRPQTPGKITATYAYRDRVFVAWAATDLGEGGGVWIFKRGRLIGELEYESTENINQILVFGSWIVGCGRCSIQVWKNTTYEQYTNIRPPLQEHNQALGPLTGHVCTMPTFLNKIFVGCQNGNVEIYNVSTGKLVHTLLAPSIDCGPVTSLAPTSALGLLVVAYSNASLVIYNVETGDVLTQLRPPGLARPITSISFRTDGEGAGDDGRDDGIMATASIESGDICLWDLNEGGKLSGVLRGAHDVAESSRVSGVTKIEFLPSQNVLVSSGLDNSLRSWVFDQVPFSPIPRILHSRSGHAAPATKLRFLPSASDGSEAAGKWLMSAGQDRSFWAFSLRKDGQSTEISQGHIKSKSKRLGNLGNDGPSVDQFRATPIIDMACSLNRDGGMSAIGGSIWSNPKTSNAEQAATTGWESVVTAHEDDKLARTWFWGRKRAGRWTFEIGDHAPVSSVAVTSCGTFALVGSASGSLDMFNLQSGQHRQRFPPRLKPSQAKCLHDGSLGGVQLQTLQGHTKAITGIVVESTNRTVVSSSLDGSVRLWDFVTGRNTSKITFGSAVPSALRYNQISGLVSLACDDGCIRILDIETNRTVRDLWGCVGQIYDHCFSNDGRWIVACSMDSVARVFDLATGHLIDAFKTSTCTNVTFSSTGEFLATAHADEIGIRLWTNKSLFMHVPTRQINESQGIIDLTSRLTLETQNEVLFEDNPDIYEEVDQMDNKEEIKQLDHSLLTLSLVPQSRWQTLLNLETIRQRNKPIQPPEKPTAAPFFLSSAFTNGTKADPPMLGTDLNTVSAAERSRISRLTSAQQSTQSRMTMCLESFASTADPAEVVMHLTSLGPSAADLEIRSLTLSEMPIFIRALTAQLRLRKDFELANTWMSVFLKVHGEFVPEVDELRASMVEWRAVMYEEEKRLGELVGYARGVVEFLRSAR